MGKRIIAYLAIVVGIGVLGVSCQEESMENELQRKKDLEQFEQRKVQQMDDPGGGGCPCRPGGCC